jgi:MarR family transcriptional regulator, transcriptional regulator for hemolysin
MKDMKWAKANSLGFLIADTARLLRKRFDQRAREVGLTRAQWQVLAYLAMNEGINQAGLADLLEIEPITLSRHLGRMEEAGLVIRQPDPRDKRARILLLSEQANRLLDGFRAVGRCVIEEITAGLTPDEIEAMKHGLRHVRAALSERGGEARSIDEEITLQKRKAYERVS